jgi:DNA repair ATPase RecN
MAEFDIDNEIRKVAENTETLMRGRQNGGSRPPTLPLTPENPKQLHYDFEKLGEQIASGMLQAAEEQLVQAQNMLEQTKQFAQDIHNRIAEKAQELADINSRLNAFGRSILRAHRKFHGEVDPEPEAVERTRPLPSEPFKLS